MKKAFSLFEIIIVLVLISILTTYLMMKSNDSLELTIDTKVKSEIALIRNSISKQKSKNILLNNETSFVLDNAKIDMKNEKLFENILDFPLVSTSSIDKEKGSWIKKSSNTYVIYVSDNQYLEYEYKDFTYECKSSLELCEKFQ